MVVAASADLTAAIATFAVLLAAGYFFGRLYPFLHGHIAAPILAGGREAWRVRVRIEETEPRIAGVPVEFVDGFRASTGAFALSMVWADPPRVVADAGLLADPHVLRFILWHESLHIVSRLKLGLGHAYGRQNLLIDILGNVLGWDYPYWLLIGRPEAPREASPALSDSRH